MFAIQLSWHWFREFGTPSTADPFIDILLIFFFIVITCLFDIVFDI